MVVFYVLLLIPMMIQHFAISNYPVSYQKRNEMAMCMFFFFLTLLVMLRHESVGADTSHYAEIFNRFTMLDWRYISDTHYEIGFAVLNKIISVVFKNPQIYLAIVAVAVSAMIYATYRRMCIDASLTIVLYCLMSTFVMMFSGIRQMLAIAIGCLAYEFTRKKNPVFFFFTVLIAMTFHTSAFLLLIMYPLYYARITKKWLYVVIPVLVVIFVFNSQIFVSLTLILSRFTKYDSIISSTGAYTMLVLFALFALFAYLIPEETDMDNETIGLRNFLLLSLVIQMFAPLHTLAMRMNYYYIIFIPLLMPKIIQYRSKRWNQVAILARHIMVVFFLIYFFVNANQEGGNLHVFPYHFFWENVY